MPYTPVQDGTQAFGIPASPVTINSVVYILEDVNIEHSARVPEIFGANGVPTGQAFIPQVPTLSGTLQLATVATVVPPVAQTFTAYGTVWYLDKVGTAYKQGDYTKVSISARAQINA